MILKRAYGLKSAGSLWSRLILDLNRAKDVVLQTVEQVRELAASLGAISSGTCTLNRKNLCPFMGKCDTGTFADAKGMV